MKPEHMKLSLQVRHVAFRKIAIYKRVLFCSCAGLYFAPLRRSSSVPKSSKFSRVHFLRCRDDWNSFMTNDKLRSEGIDSNKEQAVWMVGGSLNDGNITIRIKWHRINRFSLRVNFGFWASRKRIWIDWPSPALPFYILVFLWSVSFWAIKQCLCTESMCWVHSYFDKINVAIQWNLQSNIFQVHRLEWMHDLKHYFLPRLVTVPRTSRRNRKKCIQPTDP